MGQLVEAENAIGAEHLTPEALTREEHIRSVIKETINELLTRGGAISTTGIILAHNYNDLDIEKLPPELREKIKVRHVVSCKQRVANRLLPEETRRVGGKSGVHIIKPDTLSHTAYSMGRKKSIVLVVHELDPNETSYHFNNVSLLEAISNYAGNILSFEDPNAEMIERRKYVRDIMKEIVSENGLGDEREKRPIPQPSLLF